MTFANFVTRLYGRVTGKHSSTLTQLRELTVQQLAELSPRRTGFMESTAELTLPVADPYLGEWAGAGVAGWPLDILEIDAVYYKRSGDVDYEPLPGPVPIEEVRSYWEGYSFVPHPLQVIPSCWAWWDDKLWVPRQGADLPLRIDFFRDGTRDQATGVKITTASTNETNGWLEEGANALEYAVLAAYYALPSNQNSEQVSICNAQANAYLGNLDTRRRLHSGASFQAPMCF